jgi:hypothetical protein
MVQAAGKAMFGQQLCLTAHAMRKTCICAAAASHVKHAQHAHTVCGTPKPYHRVVIRNTIIVWATPNSSLLASCRKELSTAQLHFPASKHQAEPTAG